MSTKAHKLCTDQIEIYEETNEPIHVFNKFVGYNVYLVISSDSLNRFELKGEYLYIEMKDSKSTPKNFRIWWFSIIYFEYDMFDLAIGLHGANHITKNILNLNFDETII